MNPRDQQIALYRLGFDPGGIDGVIGPKTKAAIAAFLAGRDPIGLESYLNDASIKLPVFMRAKNFTPEHRTVIDVVVIHTAEAPEIHKEALNIAGWFALQPAQGTLVNGKPFNGTSAHYVVDDTQVVQCVLECDRAWHVGFGNETSIGIEHAGYASQDAPAWHDDYSVRCLALSAELTARLCIRFSIPIQRLTPDELVHGGRGIAGHVDFSTAFAGGHGHQDPGPAFPWDSYIADVKAAASRLAGATG
jgi:N-acetyl-anhydromuramyl-L-alanine amidase AmpD